MLQYKNLPIDLGVGKTPTPLGDAAIQKALPIDSYQQGLFIVIERYVIHGHVQHSVLQTHYKRC